MTDEPTRKRLSVGEAQEAVKDPSHPRHAEALEATARLRDQLHGLQVGNIIASGAGAAGLAETYARIGAVAVPSLGSMFGENIMRSFAGLNVENLIPKIDFTPLFEQITNSIAPAVDGIFKQFNTGLAASIKGIAEAALLAFPANWRAKDLHLPDNLDDLLDEGLPLAWVPPSTVLRKVFAAANADERRRLYASNRRLILGGVRSELAAVDNKDLLRLARFAARSVDALEAGHFEASQALSSSLLDTLLRKFLSKADRIKFTSQKNRPDTDEMDVRTALVMGAIWGAYGEFWTVNGDTVPRQFSRHATAHGVSRRQYTIANTVIALCHAVALIKFLDYEAARARR